VGRARPSLPTRDIVSRTVGGFVRAPGNSAPSTCTSGGAGEHLTSGVPGSGGAT